MNMDSSINSMWEAEREWQGGLERVLLYLRLLNVSGVEGLEIALEALRRARTRERIDSPASAVMGALRTLLEEKKISSRPIEGQENRFGSICPWPSLSEKAGVPRDAKSMPPLNRGSMTPDHL
ncbi:MAG: hypothetical protein C4576_13150 [Desulfobacteraceae bacterium]|nr:MAG: hypothetical protein C4576_13150 [Desulfobacteraceae bacterium]